MKYCSTYLLYRTAYFSPTAESSAYWCYVYGLYA